MGGSQGINIHPLDEALFVQFFDDGADGDELAAVADEVPDGGVVAVFDGGDGEGAAVEAEFVVEHHFNGHFALEMHGVAADLYERRVVQNAVLVEQVRQGDVIARLHTGDVFF